MLYLKQSTATQIVLLGPFIDEDDGKTAETGLTIANTDIRLSANGGNMFSKTSGGATHDEAGWYAATFDATDTATVGRLQVSVHVAGALPVWIEFQVLEEAIYDALFAASAAAFDANQRIDVGEWLGTAVATPNTAGVPLIDLVRIVGGLVPAPTTVGVPDVNVERWIDTLVTLSATSTKPEVDVNSISDDAGAADNVESDYDGTGFDKSNSEIGTVAVNTDMRGTEGAALATVLGALADVAADGDPTAVDTLMQYVKQLINILIGTAGVVVYPAAAAPGNGVSLAQVLRENFDDVTGIGGITPSVPGDAMDLVANAVDSGAIATGAIDADAIAADAIGASEIADGAIDASTFTSGALTALRSITSGTSDSGSSSTMVDAARTEADADYWKGAIIRFTSGTIAGQARLITAFDPGTDTITFAPNTTQAVATNTYEIYVAAGADLQLWVGVAPNALLSGAVDSDVSVIQNDVITAGAIGTAAIDADAIAPDAIGASEIATDAIGSDELATSAVQEISRAINPQVNNALSNITFEMYDSTTHNPSTGLTVTGERSLDGGAYAAVTGSITEISDGTYQLDASAADMNGALIVFRFSEATADDTFVHVKTAA